MVGGVAHSGSVGQAEEIHADASSVCGADLRSLLPPVSLGRRSERGALLLVHSCDGSGHLLRRRVSQRTACSAQQQAGDVRVPCTRSSVSGAARLELASSLLLRLSARARLARRRADGLSASALIQY